MKLPFKKGPKAGKMSGAGAPAKVGSGIAGGNMSGLGAGLSMARPVKVGRMAGMKKKFSAGEVM